MNLVIFKYGLPLLLSYILFMGISGRLNPFRKPVALAERPAWLLGVWTALSVTLVLGVGPVSYTHLTLPTILLV